MPFFTRPVTRNPNFDSEPGLVEHRIRDQGRNSQGDRNQTEATTRVTSQKQRELVSADYRKATIQVTARDNFIGNVGSNGCTTTVIYSCNKHRQSDSYLNRRKKHHSLPDDDEAETRASSDESVVSTQTRRSNSINTTQTHRAQSAVDVDRLDALSRYSYIIGARGTSDRSESETCTRTTTS